MIRRGTRTALAAALALCLPAALRAANPVTFQFKKQSDWGQGFVGEVTLANQSRNDVKDWRVRFTLPANIQGLWGAKILKHDGDIYLLEPEDYARQIRPGGKVTFGFQAAPGNSDGPQKILFQPLIAGEAPAGKSAATAEAGVTEKPIYAGSPNVNAAVGKVDVQFRVLSDWGSGYQAEVAIRNTGGAPIPDWSLRFTLPGQITGMWNARIASISSAGYVVTAMPFNRTIPPGGEVRFGFLGAPGGLVGGPKNLAFNETGATVVPTPVPEIPTPQPGQPAPPAPPPPTPLPPVPKTFNYAEALQKALYFYDAQRSGPLPRNFRVAWRGDSGLQDGADAGVDLTGGYYDAGDGVKFGLPMASAMTLLAWGGLEFRAGYERAGQWGYLLDAIRWGDDWLMKAHAAPEVLYGQVGRGDLDHAYWGPPETMQMPRPAFRIDTDHPGTELAGEAAAALAASAILFQKIDPDYAARCLGHAKDLFAFADRRRGAYSDAIADARAYYNSFSGYQDELAWAAAWLAKATGDKSYLRIAEKIFTDTLAGQVWHGTQSWDDKKYGAALLLAQLTGKKIYFTALNRWLDFWTTGDAGQKVQTTPGGLAWLDQWGSLRYAANTAFLALLYAQTPGALHAERDRAFALRQIRYMLGDNPRRSSYVVGYGVNPPTHAHHRAASGTTQPGDPGENRHILYGALVGGPSAPDDSAYVDDRSNYITNEVALDYNAGFTGALAALAASPDGGQPLENFPPPEPAPAP